MRNVGCYHISKAKILCIIRAFTILIKFHTVVLKIEHNHKLTLTNPQ